MTDALVSRLKWAQQAVAEADARLVAASKRRTDLVKEAVAAGWTQQQVADAAGITRSRINAIVTSLKERA